MQKYRVVFCLYLLPLLSLTQKNIASDSSEALFIAILQGNSPLVERLLNHDISREIGGNSPLMEAIITLGEKLIEMETQSSLAYDFPSEPKKLPNDFRSFLRSFIVSLIIATAASELQSNIEKINNEPKSSFIVLLQSLSNSFLPVISRSAYAWCAYSLLDYGIATGQKNSSNQSSTESNIIEKYKKTIEILLSKPTIDVNYTNHQGETALTLVHKYKNKIKSGRLKIVLYQIEQSLLNEKVHSTNSYNHAQNYQ